MRVIGAINHFLLPSMLSAFFVWIICFLGICIRKKEVNIKLWIIRYVFLTYISSVFMLTDAYMVFTDGIPEFFMEPNLIPFYNTISDILNNPAGSMEQISYNLILFIPFGFLTPISFPNFKWKLRKIVIVTFMAVLIVEILEFFSGRYMDIDDIFINICGSVLGYIIYNVICKIYNKANCFIKKCT